MSQYEKLSLFAKKMVQDYDDVIRLIKERHYTSESEINLILYIIHTIHDYYPDNQEFSLQALEEILKGGHLKFEDRGQLYQDLCLNFKSLLKPRTSSHQSCVQQYALQGHVIKEALIGVSVDKEGKKTTWIQLEKHSTSSLIEWIQHVWDYIQYLWTGKNIGPFGDSEYTEKTPFYIKP